MNIYIPPNNPLREDDLMHYINQLGPKFIICGDVNAHHKTWETRNSARSNNTAGVTINNILEKNNYIALATPPNLKTFTDTKSGKTSTIDLCLCSSNLLPDIEVRDIPCTGSDQYPIRVTLATEPERITRGKKEN